MKNVLILPNIRSVINVGAMFRTADAVGIDKIYLVGYTPAPMDRFGRIRKDLAKSALGAEKTVPWELCVRQNLTQLIRELKEAGFQIIAVEQDPKSVDYKKVKAKEKNAFIVGAEVEGLSRGCLDMCDVIVEIPMQGKLARNRLPGEGGKESLNVATSLGIALFRILNI